MTFRILLTSVGGAMSPYTIRSFLESKRHKIEVIGVDQSEEALGRHFATHFETVPAGSSPDYADRLIGIARKHAVDLILPCSDEEVLALTPRIADVQATGATLAAPPADAVAIMTNKLETFRFLERIGAPLPEWRQVTSRTELNEAIKELRSRHRDVAVKPIRSRGSRDVFVIERDRSGTHAPPGHRELYLDLDSFMARTDVTASRDSPLLVMQGLRAPAHDTDVLCWEGKLQQAIPRRRINPAGIPFRGGVIINDTALLDIARKVAHGLDTSWLFDIDTMSDDSGQHRVIEINCRPSGSLAAAVAAGIPILDDLVSLAKGEPVKATPLPNEVTVLPYTSIVVV